MRIAMIGSRGVGSNYGGIERVLDELCPKLADLGHQVHVYSKADTGFTGYNGVQSIATRSIGGKHLDNLTRAIFALKQAYGQYDVLHFHALGPGVLSLLTRLGGQRSVVTVHALDHKRDKWGTFARMCLVGAERTLIGSADRVTVVSESLRRYFAERYDATAEFIPNGIPNKQHVPPGTLLTAHDLVPGKYVLFASRLTPEKGCHDLIAAFNTLDATLLAQSGMKLVIAGGTAPENYLAELRAQADPERVRFVGHLGGDELAEVFSNAYAFVLPSYIEGMSMALLEAIAYALPTLASDIPENRAVLGDFGTYCAPRNVADLRRELDRLIRSPDAAFRMSNRMARLARPDWRAVAARYDHLYRTVMRRPRAIAAGAPVNA
jgi:glycosyltransferase involved in cell wall biosynthesis